MKRNRLATLLIAGITAGMLGGGIHAITNGVPDGEAHPYVAFLLFYAPDGEGNVVPQWTCTGSLLSSRVILTAGHCTNIGPGMGDATKVEVWVDSDVWAAGFPEGGVEATRIHSHPGFRWRSQGALVAGWDTVDVGVILLEEPLAIGRYAALPTPGLTESLPANADVDLVGYGAQYKLRVSGPPFDRWDTTLVRHRAASQVVPSEHTNSDRWLKLTANPGQGKGGTCFADSGGPALLTGTDVIVGTTSFATSANCTGVSYSNRVDREVVLEWVATFLR